MGTIESNYNNWLRINDLNQNQVSQFCNNNKLEQNSIVDSDNEVNKIEVSAEQAWSLCAQAQLTALPLQSELILRVRDFTLTHFKEENNKDSSSNQQAYALDHGGDKPAEVSCSYSQTADDLILMMHEFSHAVQLMLSYANNVNDLVMPPVARECCAFIGELALLEFTSVNNPYLHHKLLKVWHANNQVYLGSDLIVLNQHKNTKNDHYNYRWNYPIARKAASIL